MALLFSHSCVLDADSPCFGKSLLLGVFKISALESLSIVFECGRCQGTLKGSGSQLPLTDHLGSSGPLHCVFPKLGALLNAGDKQWPYLAEHKRL